MSIATLLHLMMPQKLSANLKLGQEDKICIEFANRLRAWTLQRQLIAVWSHIPNELAGGTNNAKIRYAIAKALGMITGTADYLFLWRDGAAALEVKAARGIQSEGQKHFQVWCEMMGVPYFVVYSADEGERTLRNLGILK